MFVYIIYWGPIGCDPIVLCGERRVSIVRQIDTDRLYGQIVLSDWQWVSPVKYTGEQWAVKSTGEDTGEEVVVEKSDYHQEEDVR